MFAPTRLIPTIYTIQGDLVKREGYMVHSLVHTSKKNRTVVRCWRDYIWKLEELDKIVVF